MKDTASKVLGFSKPRKNRERNDPEIEKLSLEQRDLRLRIENTKEEAIKDLLKHQRNQVLHDIRRRSLQSAEKILEERAEEVERLKNGAQMYKAVQLMKRRSSRAPRVHDGEGRFVGSNTETVSIVRDHFQSQFSDSKADQIPPFIADARPLQHPVTVAEMETCLLRLNNGRAAGPDDMPGELLKYGARSLAPEYTRIVNQMFETHQLVPLGYGTLIPLQKPGKQAGPPGNLRSIS